MTTTQDAGETEPTDRKRILIVDDEAFVRETGCAMMGMLGYDVRSVESAKAAEACLEKEAQPFDLLLIDLNMPDIPGDECFLRLKELHPALRAAIITGSIKEDSRIRALLPHGLIGMIEKPFTLDVLEEKLAAFISVE